MQHPWDEDTAAEVQRKMVETDATMFRLGRALAPVVNTMLADLAKKIAQDAPPASVREMQIGRKPKPTK